MPGVHLWMLILGRHSARAHNHGARARAPPRAARVPPPPPAASSAFPSASPLPPDSDAPSPAADSDRRATMPRTRTHSAARCCLCRPRRALTRQSSGSSRRSSSSSGRRRTGSRSSHLRTNQNHYQLANAPADRGAVPATRASAIRFRCSSSPDGAGGRYESRIRVRHFCSFLKCSPCLLFLPKRTCTFASFSSTSTFFSSLLFSFSFFFSFLPQACFLFLFFAPYYLAVLQ